MKKTHLCDTTSYKFIDIKEPVMFLHYDYLSISCLGSYGTGHIHATLNSNIHRMYNSRIKVFDEGYGGKGLARGSIEFLACALQGLGSPPSSTRRVRDELFNCRAQRVFLLCETAATIATLMIAVSSSTCGCFQWPFVARRLPSSFLQKTA